MRAKGSSEKSSRPGTEREDQALKKELQRKSKWPWGGWAALLLLRKKWEPSARRRGKADSTRTAERAIELIGREAKNCRWRQDV